MILFCQHVLICYTFVTCIPLNQSPVEAENTVLKSTLDVNQIIVIIMQKLVLQQPKSLNQELLLKTNDAS